MFEFLDDPEPLPYDASMRSAIRARATLLRRRRRVRQSALAVVGVLVVAMIGAFLRSGGHNGRPVRVVASPPATKPAPPSVPAPTSSVSTPSSTPARTGPTTTLLSGLTDPIGWLGPAGVYLATPSSASNRDETLRLVDERTGRVDARADLEGDIGNFERLVVADGDVWFVLSPSPAAPHGELVGLSATTLAVRHRVALPQGVTGIGVAAAAGSIWVDGDDNLLKVDPRSGTLTELPLLAAATDDLASNPEGTILAATQFGDVLDILDPRNGRLVAVYQGTDGDGAEIPAIGDGQVFVYTGIGMSGGIERFDLATHTFTPLPGGDRPQIVVSGQRLLDTTAQPSGTADYCGVAATGKVLAALPPEATPKDGGRTLGYSDGDLFYTATSGLMTTLERTPLPDCS